MQGNTLGPVLLIVAGIALGYLVITQRVGNLMTLFTGNPAPAVSAATAANDAAGVNGTPNGVNGGYTPPAPTTGIVQPSTAAGGWGVL